jgi:hypothetical protein
MERPMGRLVLFAFVACLGSSIDPLIQGGIGVIIRAFRRVGISGLVELYVPVLSPHVESVHYRGSLGIAVRLGGE